MRLKWFHVREFQSVQDSGRVSVDDISCLVGKNEAGKSALLKALYRLNPVVPSEGNFSVTNDYPRMEVENYRIAVEQKKRVAATPITACYQLDADEVEAIEELFGSECLKQNEFTLSKSYSGARTFGIDLNYEKALRHFVSIADFAEQTRQAVASAPTTVDALLVALETQEQTDEVTRVVAALNAIKKRNLTGYIFDSFLSDNEPSYLYFDEYYQMTGHENIEALMAREASEQLKPSDHPLLGLVRLARLQLSELVNPDSTIELKNKLEGASNHLTRQILKYWSQNKHLRMAFDVRPARSGDPVGMQKGTNIWGGVFDNRHQVTTELGSRSRGFVWFFSFLAWYSDVKKGGENTILLLDEPGLTLHAKAQHDLLRYFEIELKGAHQLIYSTHSPFMIDAEHFERVRIVQDRSIDSEQDDDLSNSGTKVLTDVFAASDDSLFPLQGALGYDLHQTLFVGPQSLVVEGAADLLYIQAMSSLLMEEGRRGLDARWTITPVGGASKVPTFVALLGSQKGMTIATLIDSQVSDLPKIEALYRDKLLKKANVFTFADFTGAADSDIEDMFGADFFVDLVNSEFASQLNAPLDAKKLVSKHPRILRRLEDHFDKHPMKTGSFNHFRPARHFNENIKKLAKKVPKEAKDRFEAAFKKLNALLP
ncbi:MULTISPECIES: AAA family ATPase [unclassified Mesorhizobium]|uniref:AAA family ATPase n=1 Tax=unclassified Mesorhizobium TaxID=325217 RepID=UPI00333655CC